MQIDFKWLVLIQALGALTLNLSSPADAQSQLTPQVMNAIADAANKICQATPLGSEDRGLELKASVSASLEGMFLLLASTGRELTRIAGAQTARPHRPWCSTTLQGRAHQAAR